MSQTSGSFAKRAMKSVALGALAGGGLAAVLMPSMFPAALLGGAMTGGAIHVAWAILFASNTDETAER